jgi:hypothetical protein
MDDMFCLLLCWLVGMIWAMLQLGLFNPHKHEKALDIYDKSANQYKVSHSSFEKHYRF